MSGNLFHSYGIDSHSLKMRKMGEGEIFMNPIEALEKIHQKSWYSNTTQEIATKLDNLSDGWTGYLVDLANRNDVVGGLRHVSMVDLLLGNFACITKFKVVNQDQKEYTYEYVSWNKGPQSGAKGLVFLADKSGKITGFVYLEAEKFAAGGVTCVDLPGGFCEDIDMAVATKFLANMTREITEEFGAKSLEIIRIDNLGKIAPDYGMSNNAPFVFSVVVSADIQYDGINTDKLEVAGKVHIRPIEELRQFVSIAIDGYFLACIAKMWANGTLPLI